MKLLLFEPLRNWFGYSRRERRASFILMLLIVVVIIARYVVPVHSHDIDIETIAIESGISGSDSPVALNNDVKARQPSRQKIQVKHRQLLELNSCDSADLEGLPGIGPVLAKRIIKYRNLLGGFVSSGQLREVYGLSDSTYTIISKRVKADSSKVEKIDLNSVDFKRLIRLPYLEKYDVTSILKYRELQGRIENLDELVKNKIITQEKAKKVRPYVEFGELSPPSEGEKKS
jgi:DNA uptake protein ComE-like DNA-binding protein